MFADEAKVDALLTHPNIVQVFDFGRVDGQYYLAMEWIQGHSLDRLLRQAIRSSRVVGLAVADALAKTLPDGTPLKLVHRDVTPGNVLYQRDGTPAIVAFSKPFSDSDQGRGGQRLVEDYQVPGQPNAFTGMRYAVDVPDDAGNAAVKELPTQLLLNLFVRAQDVGTRGLEIGAGVYNLTGTNFRIAQPYNGGHAPMPVFSREFMVRVSYLLDPVGDE